MEFNLSETQEAVRGLAAQIFEGQATVERVREVERSDERIDERLWSELAKADLLGLVLPEADGGGGYGMVELCLVLQQQGRRVAPVPLLPTMLAALAVAEHGSDEQRAQWLPGVIAGDVVLSVALSQTGSADPTTPTTTASRDGDGWALQGFKPSVPAGHVAQRVVVPAAVDGGGVSLFLVDPAADDVRREVAEATNRERVAHLTLDGTRVGAADVLGTAGEAESALRRLVEQAMTGYAAIQVGIADEALRTTAEYTSNRHQFGRPLSTNQGVSLRAADAYIDTRAMEVTLWQAAWRLDEGLDATRQVLAAKWWAAEGGQRVVHATQHLHGGMGADVDYPIHRYFLWGKQIEQTLGGASEQLARLGRILAEVGAS